MSFQVALVQGFFPQADPEHNLVKARTMVEQASNTNADLVLLPELWASGYDLEHCARYASPLGEGFFASMESLAKQYGIGVGGSLIEATENGFFNTFVLIDPEQGTIGSYRKIHLFQLLQEERYFQSGGELCLLETRWGKIGLATCYDLRFPELFRAYSARGAELILLAAEWPQRRIAHWTILLQARAIENQCFIAAVNKVGASQGEQLGGCSAVYSPMGETLVQGGPEEELLLAELDLSEVEKARRWMPVIQDRKPELYCKFFSEKDE
jgi:omega-amidase